MLHGNQLGKQQLMCIRYIMEEDLNLLGDLPRWLLIHLIHDFRAYLLTSNCIMKV